MSRESKLAKNTFILAIGSFLPKLASFITLPILSGCLTKEEYGTYDLITVLVSLVLPSATMQIQTAAFRFLIDVREQKEEIKKIVSTIIAFIIPVSLAALCILYLFLPGDQVAIKLFICAYFLADIVVNGMRQIARGLEKNLDYSISAIVSALGKMIFAVIFVWYYQIGLLGAVIALFAASSISLVVLLLKSKLYQLIDIRCVSMPCLKKMLSYSWPMIPNSMSMWVMRVSDRFVVTLILGPAVNAVYSIANKIPSLLTLAQTTFTMAWQENASIVSKDEDAGAYYSSMFRTMFDLMAGAMGLLISMTPILFKLLVRGDYADAYPHIPILFLAMFFYSMSSFLGGIYVAYMDTKSVGITTVVSAACNLIINFALINYIGLYAASISTLVSYILLFYYRMFNVRKLINMQYQHVHLTLVLGLMLIESILCFMQNPLLNWINAAFSLVVFFALNKSFVLMLYRKGMGIIHKKIGKQ